MSCRGPNETGEQKRMGVHGGRDGEMAGMDGDERSAAVLPANEGPVDERE